MGHVGEHFDAVLLPALRLAEQDRRRGALPRQVQHAVVEGCLEVVEEPVALADENGEPEETEPVPDPSLPLLEIATQGSIAFDTDRLEAPAAEPFQIRFRNASDQIHKAK